MSRSLIRPKQKVLAGVSAALMLGATLAFASPAANIAISGTPVSYTP